MDEKSPPPPPQTEETEVQSLHDQSVGTEYISHFSNLNETTTPEGGSPTPKRKAGRRKIPIEFIEDKSRRQITFSKRKAGLMKKVCFVLFCFVLFCFVLFCFVLFCFVLFCFVCLF